MEKAVENCIVTAGRNIYSMKTELTGSKTMQQCKEYDAWIDAMS
jgi:hypothetical protein